MAERIFQGSGRTVRNIVAKARRLIGIGRKASPVLIRSGGEDGLYRIHLQGGFIIEGTIAPGRTYIQEVYY